jgi:hypothetical protein
MGRRSRKRSSSTVAPPPPREAPPTAPPAAPRTATYKSRREDAPQPAWAPFPLTELVILLALVMLAIGFFSSGDRRGVFIGIGLVLASLGGGELALREHFAGFRSHTMLIAALCGFVAGAVTLVLGAPKGAVLAVAVAVAVVAVPFLRRAFMRRSGGLGFRA